jgi:hypothetical protein
MNITNMKGNEKITWVLITSTEIWDMTQIQI